MVQHIADEDPALTARLGVDDDITRGVARIGFELQPVVERVIVADQQRLPGLDDG